jgi:hypothetical protein
MALPRQRPGQARASTPRCWGWAARLHGIVFVIFVFVRFLGQATCIVVVVLVLVLVARWHHYRYAPRDPSYDSIKRHLQLWWPKVKSGREGGDKGGEKRKGGILAGHDYTAARAGVPLAVNEFADARGLKLRLTGVQRPRRDVRGNQIPPCCPSWYIEKP